MRIHDRTHFLLILLALGGILPGCKSEREEVLEARVVELVRKLDDVRSHLGEAESAVSKLKSEIDDLNSAIGNFGDEPWREVVPEVEAAASEVESAANAAESAVAEALAAAD